MKKATHTDPLKANLASWIAAGGSIAKFAEDNPGTSERTFRRWTKEPGFQAEVRRQSSALIEDVRRRMTGASLKATQTLYTLLDNPNPTVRLGAAKAILDKLLDVHDTADITRRLDELEEQARNAKLR